MYPFGHMVSLMSSTVIRGSVWAAVLKRRVDRVDGRSMDLEHEASIL